MGHKSSPRFIRIDHCFTSVRQPSIQLARILPSKVPLAALGYCVEEREAHCDLRSVPVATARGTLCGWCALGVLGYCHVGHETRCGLVCRCRRYLLRALVVY